jgi:hypothetical protein
MYVILTSKPGQFRTEVVAHLRPVEAYDYLFYGRLRARFLIAELTGDTRIRVIDETEPVTVNDMPSKFLERFQSIESARRELQHLCPAGDMESALVPRDAASFHLPTPAAA